MLRYCTFYLYGPKANCLTFKEVYWLLLALAILLPAFGSALFVVSFFGDIDAAVAVIGTILILYGDVVSLRGCGICVVMRRVPYFWSKANLGSLTLASEVLKRLASRDMFSYFSSRSCFRWLTWMLSCPGFFISRFS